MIMKGTLANLKQEMEQLIARSSTIYQVENTGIDPVTSRMLSEHSTI